MKDENGKKGHEPVVGQIEQKNAAGKEPVQAPELTFGEKLHHAILTNNPTTVLNFIHTSYKLEQEEHKEAIKQEFINGFTKLLKFEGERKIADGMAVLAVLSDSLGVVNVAVGEVTLQIEASASLKGLVEGHKLAKAANDRVNSPDLGDMVANEVGQAATQDAVEAIQQRSEQGAKRTTIKISGDNASEIEPEPQPDLQARRQPPPRPPKLTKKAEKAEKVQPEKVPPQKMPKPANLARPPVQPQPQLDPQAQQVLQQQQPRTTPPPPTPPPPQMQPPPPQAQPNLVPVAPVAPVTPVAPVARAPQIPDSLAPLRDEIGALQAREAKGKFLTLEQLDPAKGEIEIRNAIANRLLSSMSPDLLPFGATNTDVYTKMVNNKVEGIYKDFYKDGDNFKDGFSSTNIVEEVEKAINEERANTLVQAYISRNSIRALNVKTLNKEKRARYEDEAFNATITSEEVKDALVFEYRRSSHWTEFFTSASQAASSTWRFLSWPGQIVRAPGNIMDNVADYANNNKAATAAMAVAGYMVILTFLPGALPFAIAFGGPALLIIGVAKLASMVSENPILSTIFKAFAAIGVVPLDAIATGLSAMVATIAGAIKTLVNGKSFVENYKSCLAYAPFAASKLLKNGSPPPEASKEKKFESEHTKFAEDKKGLDARISGLSAADMAKALTSDAISNYLLDKGLMPGVLGLKAVTDLLGEPNLVAKLKEFFDRSPPVAQVKTMLTGNPGLQAVINQNPGLAGHAAVRPVMAELNQQQPPVPVQPQPPAPAPAQPQAQAQAQQQAPTTLPTMATPTQQQQQPTKAPAQPQQPQVQALTPVQPQPQAPTTLPTTTATPTQQQQQQMIQERTQTLLQQQQPQAQTPAQTHNIPDLRVLGADLNATPAAVDQQKAEKLAAKQQKNGEQGRQ